GAHGSEEDVPGARRHLVSPVEGVQLPSLNPLRRRHLCGAWWGLGAGRRRLLRDRRGRIAQAGHARMPPATGRSMTHGRATSSAAPIPSPPATAGAGWRWSMCRRRRLALLAIVCTPALSGWSAQPGEEQRAVVPALFPELAARIEALPAFVRDSQFTLHLRTFYQNVETKPG